MFGPFGSIVNGGKTIAGAILMVASTIGAALTPEDLATIQALLAGANTAGVWVAGIGLLHKLWKLLQGQVAA